MHLTDDIVRCEIHARRAESIKIAADTWQRRELKRLSDNVQVAEHALHPVLLRGMEAPQIARREAKLADARRWLRLTTEVFSANT